MTKTITIIIIIKTKLYYYVAIKCSFEDVHLPIGLAGLTICSKSILVYSSHGVSMHRFH